MASIQHKESVPIRAAHSDPVHANGTPAEEQGASLHGLAVTEEDYWAHYYEAEISYEWNNGILEEKPVSDYRTVMIYGWFLMLLRAYLEVNPIAKLIFLETAFRLALPDKTTIRKPDLFVVRNDNPVPVHDTDRSFRGVCDLCVEALSDSTRAEVERDTVVKKQEYASIGVKEYYILDWGERTAFYRRTPAGAYESIRPDEEGVIHSEVLPGFQFRVDDLHTQPSLESMAEDPVYRHFVLLKYQAVKEQAERYAAKLRELGIEDV